MSSATTLVLLSMSVLYVEVNCQCTAPIGTNSEIAFTAERDHRFYLNTAHPALCNGTINRWRYCFYDPGNLYRSNRIYKTSFAVYRAIVGTGDSIHYQRVSNVTTVSWRGSEITRSPSFNCYNVSINSFRIQAGDFVAACIYDPTGSISTRQLDIVGQGTTDYSIMRTGNGYSQCNENSLPSSISSSQLSSKDSRILHLYTTITVPVIPTTLPPTTTMSITEQTTTVPWTTATPSDATSADMTTTASGDTTRAPPNTPSKFQTSDAMTWNTMIPTSYTTSDNIPKDETPSSTAYLTTTLPSAGNQAARVIIAAGSAGGGLLVLLFVTMVVIIAAIVCLMLKRKVHNLSANIEYNTKTSTEECNIYNIVTNTNASYKQTATLDAKLEVLYDTTNPVEGTTGLQESTDWDSKLNMEENVAYESSIATQISLRSNAAYYKSGTSLKEIDQAKDCNDQYDYIYI